jgi:hypothetical protein
VPKFVAKSSEATGLAWEAPSISRVLQIINTSTTTTETSTSSTYADTGVTATITPSSASSTILVMVSLNGVFHDTGVTYPNFRLRRSTTTIAESIAVGGNLNGIIDSVSISKMDNPATTSATTYTIQMASSANVSRVQLNRTDDTSTIILMEYL